MAYKATIQKKQESSFQIKFGSAKRKHVSTRKTAIKQIIGVKTKI